MCRESFRGARRLRWPAISTVLALGAGLGLLAATPAKSSKAGTKKTVAKTKAKTAPAKSASAKKTTSTKKSASAKKSASSKQAAARYRRSTQREPAPERYQEIQQSLADRGYFSGVVNGNWGPDSVAALKRFQRDQNIGDDGKLGSLSLIALGLGPKRSGDAAQSPANPPPGGALSVP